MGAAGSALLGGPTNFNLQVIRSGHQILRITDYILSTPLSFQTSTARRSRKMVSTIFYPKVFGSLQTIITEMLILIGYRKCSQDLGVVKSEVITLACLLPVPWYWAVLRSMFFEYPMVSALWY